MTFNDIMRDNKCCYSRCTNPGVFRVPECSTCGLDHWCPSVCGDHTKLNIDFVNCASITHTLGSCTEKECKDIIHHKYATKYLPGNTPIIYLWTINDYVLKYNFRLGTVTKGKMMYNDNIFIKSETSLNLDEFKIN